MSTPSSAPVPIKTERAVRILIADDHATVRQMVWSTLEQQPHFEVCAEVCDGAKAVQGAQQLKPDVVVLNVSMPIMNGFDAAREIKATVLATAIVILSSNADERFIEQARKIGVRVYVAKTKAGEELVRVIESAIAGGNLG